MDHHPHSDVMAPIFVWRDLQLITIHADTVIGIDRSLFLLAKNIIEICPDPRNERWPFFGGRLHELGVETGIILLGQIAVCDIHIGDSLKSQLLGKPVLVGQEGTFASPPGFWRIGCDHLNPQVFHGAAELGELCFAHLAPLLGRDPVVASPVRVQRAE